MLRKRTLKGTLDLELIRSIFFSKNFGHHTNSLGVEFDFKGKIYMLFLEFLILNLLIMQSNSKPNSKEGGSCKCYR